MTGYGGILQGSRGRRALQAVGIVLAGVAVIVLLVLVLGNGTAPPVDREPVSAAGDTAGPEAGSRAGATPAALSCRVAARGQLPAEVHESSGLARSTRDPALLWTHNDSGNEPVLYALGPDGRVAGAVRVQGASLADWEDIEAGPCLSGDGGCLYVADIGDNQAQRDHVTIYQVAEPQPGEAAVAATPIRVRYPGGARDAEGLFLAAGRLHVVSKGREGPIRLYRLAEEPAADDIAMLDPVTDILPRPEASVGYVTAATASPDGEWVAIRTYGTLHLLRTDSLLAGAPGEIHRFDLRPLREPQGEGVAMSEQGDVWLTSERRGGAPPVWTRLSCDLPGP